MQEIFTKQEKVMIAIEMFRLREINKDQFKDWIENINVKDNR